MSTGCPIGRNCEKCIYTEICGGCIEESCVHRRIEKGRHRADEKCLFCERKGIADSCHTGNPPPPAEFQCLGPWVIDDLIKEWDYHRDEITDPPSEPRWPLLIPELSDITETTSRLGVWPDEGEWQFDNWDPVAWDMTGYLFDKIQGAQWVHEPEVHEEHDWHHFLGPKENWITNLLMVDRLPDRLAMQTPPSSIMVAYLNRLYAYHYQLRADEDAPSLWLLTHGYPSYIDWPPMWHWNLGIRMLGSLASYIGSQGEGLMGAPTGTLYPDKSRETSQQLRIPFASLPKENRLLFRPQLNLFGPKEMDWIHFPGIIPFVPGANTNQLEWFTKKIVELGYSTVALDAVNSIAHETFSGLREAVSATLRGGASHVIIYGPWPLHPPSKYTPTEHVSYIPSANHIDLTNRPPRFWRRPDSGQGEKEWKRLPNYRIVTLGDVASREHFDVCSCSACESAKKGETDPRSIWRWGHLLEKGKRWMKRVQELKEKETTSQPENTLLRYQGPSYTVYRKCLHYPSEIQWESIEDLIDTISFRETRMEIRFPDGITSDAENIRWTWWDEGHHWAWKFPHLED